MAMNFRERLEMALNEYGENASDLDNLLAYAYYKGRTDGARDVSDRATAKFKAQKKRADASRYYRFANAIIGEADSWTNGKGFVYSPDYSGDYAYAFGTDIWNG